MALTMRIARALRRERALYAGILGLSALSALWTAGCKETDKTAKKQTPQAEFRYSEVSRQIDRLNLTGAAPAAGDNAEKRQKSQTAPPFPVIDIASMLSGLQPEVFGQADRLALSKFPTDPTQYRISVSVQFKGMPKSVADIFDERLFARLTALAPQPWILQRARNFEKSETADARLNIAFKRELSRKKSYGKQVPARTVIQFELAFSFSGMTDYDVSWRNWRYHWSEETVSLSDAAISERFWRDLETRIPALTATDREKTAQWLRAQGLSPAILSGDIGGIASKAHVYCPDGCLLSPAAPNDPGRESLIRSVLDLEAPPQALSVADPEDLHCDRNGIFTLSAESPVQLNLYYQAMTAENAWKTTIRLGRPAAQGTVRIHADDDLICIVPRQSAAQTRFAEISCLSRKNGLARWKTGPVPGAFAGFAYDEKQIVLATDQAIAAISRGGEVLDVKKIETRSRLRARLSCQLGNRLLFAAAPGEFVAYNLSEHVFDWQYRALNSEFLFCGEQNTVILSESGGWLLAADVEQNAPKWRFKSVALPLDIISRQGIVYVLSERAVTAIDNDTGRILAQIPLPWRATSFIKIGRNVYFDAPDEVYPWQRL